MSRAPLKTYSPLRLGLVMRTVCVFCGRVRTSSRMPVALVVMRLVCVTGCLIGSLSPGLLTTSQCLSKHCFAMPRAKNFLTPAEFAVLGLLRRKPAYGYELQRSLGGSTGLGLVCPVEPAMV